jgi:chaperonin GroES
MAKPRQVRATASVTLQEENTVAAKLQPIADRVVVKPVQKEEMTASGLIIPDTAKEKPQEGEVIAVGAGKLLDNGERARMEVKVGDRVLFAKYGGTEFKLDGDELLVLRESDILAVIAREK